MQKPREKDSSVVADLRKKRDPLQVNRIRVCMLLSFRISSELQNKGIGKLEFSKMMKKNPSVITKWLSGVHNFTSDTLSDIQTVLGIELLNLDINENSKRAGNPSNYTFDASQTKVIPLGKTMYNKAG